MTVSILKCIFLKKLKPTLIKQCDSIHPDVMVWATVTLPEPHGWEIQSLLNTPGSSLMNALKYSQAKVFCIPLSPDSAIWHKMLYEA